MPAKRAPSVLIVDDVLDENVRRLERQLKQRKFQVHSTIPEDVTKPQLFAADLVLVGYELEKWPERDGLPISRQPTDGLALATLLRRHIADDGGIEPTAFASYTARL